MIALQYHLRINIICVNNVNHSIRKNKDCDLLKTTGKSPLARKSETMKTNLTKVEDGTIDASKKFFFSDVRFILFLIN